MMLATPIAPTSRATAPQAEEQGVERALVSARAVSASDGRETVTWFGLSGLACAASRLSTAVVTAGSLTVRKVSAGCPSKPRYFSAAGKPTRTAESISGA